MDVFGKKFQNELEQMKKDVAKWQNSPNETFISPPLAPDEGLQMKKGVESIPLLEEQLGTTSMDVGTATPKERKSS